MQYYVYILASASNTVIYTGVTNNLMRRVFQHKNKIDPSCFTARYNVDRLVYYEVYGDIRDAIAREKQIKSWNRKRKDGLVKMKTPVGWIYTQV